VVKSPYQIKSATDNDGTFDPENSNVRKNPGRTMTKLKRTAYRCGRSGDSLVWKESFSYNHRFTHGPGVYFTADADYAERYCQTNSSIYVVEISGLLLPSESLVDFHPDYVPPHPDVERLSSLPEYRQLIDDLVQRGQYRKAPRWNVTTSLHELADDLGPDKFLAAMRRIGVVGTAGRSGGLPEEYAVFDHEAIHLIEEIPWKYKRNAGTNHMQQNTFIPPKMVALEAEYGLYIRSHQPPSNRCCTPVGLARAKQLKNREPVSVDTLKRMRSYFQRHEVDKMGRNWGIDSKGFQAWLLWGGDSGRKWCNQILAGIGE